MRHLQHPEGVILHLLHEAETGSSIAEICSTARISPRTFYRWRKRYGGLTLPAMIEMKDLHLENLRLRSLVTSLSARLNHQSKDKQGLSERTYCADRQSDAAAMHGASPGRYASIRGQR